MTISTYISLDDLYEGVGHIRFLSNGCFGNHNYFQGSNLPVQRGENHSPTIGGRRTLNYVSDKMESLEFFPHVSSTAANISLIEEAVKFFNTIGFYSGMFVVSPVNSIWVNLRENPADKVFTGLMSIRDYLYNGGTMNHQLVRDVSNLSEEEIMKRKRIGMFLGLAGVTFSMMHGMNFSTNSSNGGNESCSIFAPRDMDALAAYYFVYGTKEQCIDAFAQSPVGQGNNRAGYIRNGHDTQSVRNARSYRDDSYSAMSHWLRAWVDNPGHKDPVMDSKRGRMTLDQIIDRIRQRTARVSDVETKIQIILEIFEEIKEYYE